MPSGLNILIQYAFIYSIIFTAISFFSIGLIKGKVVDKPILRSGLNTLSIGVIAAYYSVHGGSFVKRICKIIFRSLIMKLMKSNTFGYQYERCYISYYGFSGISYDINFWLRSYTSYYYYITLIHLQE